MSMKQYTISIHIDKFLSHNARSADPLDPYAKAMKEISSKRKKTDADHEQLALIEYEAGLYLDSKKQVIIPGRIFEAAIAEGAKIAKEGKQCLSSVIVEDDAIITYDGGPLSLDELKVSDDHRLVVPVRVGQARIMRTRPMFSNVEAKFTVSLATEIANPAQLKRWIEDCLNLKGLGDWRPRYGRGYLLSFEEMKAPVAKAA
jgi:hypothetical protein